MSEPFAHPRVESPATNSLRNVFFALRPDDAVADSIMAAGNALSDVNVASVGRRLKRHRLHMTALFLDKFPVIPETHLQHAIDVGEHIATSPFDMTIDIAGSFRTGDRPWWLGCSNVPPPLVALHRQLYTGMQSRGETPRGGASLTPHVTISRTNREMLPTTPIAPIQWRVEEICLIESVVGKREFDVLKIWKLRGNG